MNLIICLDNENGMAFNNRRQSRDRKQRLHMYRLIGRHTLRISPYSRKLIEEEAKENGIDVRVSETYITDAGRDDFVFCEIDDIGPYLELADHLYIYNWNRQYLAELYFPDFGLGDFITEAVESFSGSSHAKITFEGYRR